MLKKRRGQRIFPNVTIESLRILNGLIPFRMSETITARSDKLSIAVLQKIFGPEWIEDHIKAQKGFLVCDNTSPEIRETRGCEESSWLRCYAIFRTCREFTRAS